MKQTNVGGNRDNIELFNELTHDKKGAIDEVIFKKLIEDFKYFILFKKICGNNHTTQCRNEKRHIKFRMEFNTGKIAKDFINYYEDNDIKYKGVIYKPICTQISQQIIDVYFIKK